MLLFCARGGLRLKLAYERFLTRTGLPPRLPRAALMVSRLVAARTAFHPPSPGVLSELEREFSGQSMAEIAAALAQRDDLALPPQWYAPFQKAAFVALLAGSEPAVAILHEAVAEQDALFRAHLAASAGNRHQCVLVDTGLYGSTVRILQEGVPDRQWSGLQFARCNYKRLPTPHFPRTLGLSVESDWYKPWEVRTSALRFWQLIEACLEPELPSVRTFSEGPQGAPPRANLQVAGWENRVEPDQPGLFTGVLAYIDALTPETLQRVPGDASRAWHSLKGAVVWPDRQAVTTLSLGGRSRDFGRTELRAQFAGSGVTNPLRQIRESLWREGAVIRSFPRAGRLVLALIELIYAGRALRMELQARRRRVP
ncbi:glycosyltransferase [Methylobacterium sp. NEAU K]|uniref:glycosyltransferase n=1 Tax=Methylobacterium sp. NEAU K TaxID=3064946 RepID=UPI002735D95D|nr:glycosyltransferase [Methylobacterium sp. NEAU K]